MKPTERQEWAQNRIHDLLAELAELIGPAGDGQAEEDLDPDEMPQGAVLLPEWVTVMSWVDETGAGFTTRTMSPGLASHHLSGLLHDGLWRFGD